MHEGCSLVEVLQTHYGYAGLALHCHCNKRAAWNLSCGSDTTLVSSAASSSLVLTLVGTLEETRYQSMQHQFSTSRR
jgi:hypothetical protein